MIYFLGSMFALWLQWGCKPSTQSEPMVVISSKEIKKDTITETKKVPQKEIRLKPKKSPHDGFVNIRSLSDDFVLDIKYATDDNFLQQSVYDCAECYLREATAKALADAQSEFMKMGYRIKVFDCYRPLSVQEKMWKIMPGTHYVANPAKGSKHNKGAAVDLTLVDASGEELDMGTPYDFFGKEAHHTYTNLPKEVLKNRELLKSVMDKHNFRSIYSEWWHYEYRPERHSEIENFIWDCEQ